MGSDHGGYDMKELLKGFLESEGGYRVVDLGTHAKEPVDYPDFAHKVATAVARGEATFGIVVDGVGVGSCMAANKHAGIRAATGDGILQVTNAREHNDANVLCLGGRTTGDLLARALVMVFLTTAFGGGRHARRVGKIEAT
ncbi:MAG: ribose-5-phosphate isomerase [Planctomycetes bacterium]|nr:ribose-5-phosphate isomerase [Planctomycetota bacterium]